MKAPKQQKHDDEKVAPQKTGAKSESIDRFQPQISQNHLNTTGAQTPGDIPLTAENMLYLQRTVGNQAVTNLIQAKLKIGQPNDVYEREADRVAEHVLRMPESSADQGHDQSERPDDTAIRRSGGDDRVQRQTAVEEEEKRKRQEQESIHAKEAANQTPTVSEETEAQIETMRGGGEPLPEDERDYFEQRFGADFGDVRVHKDARAAESAGEINARAFTTGQDVMFGSGEYAPDTKEGKKLLAQELAHVVQQSSLSSLLPKHTLTRSHDKMIRRWSHTTSSEGEIRAIQQQLRRLGLYTIRVDGIWGPMTEIGLVEAFGGEEWQNLAYTDLLIRLRAAAKPTGRRREHNLRYGELFRDGLLDITLGIGFDETNAHLTELQAIKDALVTRGFVRDKATAQRLYKTAKRTMGKSAFGEFFIKENALIYTPPAGASRPVHVVVRLVSSSSGTQGAQAATAFKEGMVESDVALYGGHGRYGSGPDFDRNMRFELLDRNKNIVRQIDDYNVLQRTLRREGKRSGRSAWQQFLWRVRNNRINVIGSNLGNIYLNRSNRHSSEFGARLMYWNLRRSGSQGSTTITGRNKQLAQDIAAHPERRYRIWLFDGCRTQDYVQNLRATPGVDTRSTDLFVSRRTLYWDDIASTLAAFIDSLIEQRTAEQIIREMDSTNVSSQSGKQGHAFQAQGVQDNPIIR